MEGRKRYNYLTDAETGFDKFRIEKENLSIAKIVRNFLNLIKKLCKKNHSKNYIE